MPSNEKRDSDSRSDCSRDHLPLGRRDYLQYTGAVAVGPFTATGGAAAQSENAESDRDSVDENTQAPTDLRVEYAQNPIGVDTKLPRFSWNLVSEQRELSQTAYRILVASSRSALDSNTGDVWDSGKVEASRSTHIEYDGPSLEPSSRYHWVVQVWDSDDSTSDWSDPAYWETGLLDEENWTAQWIGRTGENEDSDELPGDDWTDYSYEVDVTLLEAAAGLVFRAQDAGNLYMWQINTVRSSEPLLRPHIRENGSWSTLDSVSLQDTMGGNPHEQHHVRIDLVGDQITTSIDGQQIHQVTDSTHTAGTIGFRQNGAEHARFDNVLVTRGGGEVLFEETFDGLTVETFSGGSIVDGQLDIQGGGVVLRSSGRLNPSPLLRSEVSFDADVVDARAYVSGLGFYELYVNGKRIGDQVLDPAQTDYEHTVLYASHDVTDALQRGENALGVALGRGRYGELADNVWGWDDAPWWSDPELRLQMEVTFDDGSTTTITSDGDWRVTDGPTRRDSLYAGEFYDAREEKTDWTAPGYDDADWAAVDVVEGPVGDLTAQRVQPIKTFETLESVDVSEPASGVYVFDVGQMIAGWTELSVEGPTGTAVKMTMGEKLHDDGTVNNANNLISEPMQTDTYVLNGEGTETWESRFSYKGFRYVQVEGYPGTPTTDDITATVVHSAIDENVDSDFACSDDLLTQIHENTQWAFLNNHHGIPTDTPTYEKNGWTGDALVMAETGMFNFHLARFYTKWLADVRDAQLDAPEVIGEEGNVPVIVPTADWGYEGWTPDPAWQSVYPLLAWWTYQYYGDRRILKDHYVGITSYVRYLQRKADDNIIRDGLGDWVAPGGGNVPPEGPGIVSTAYYYRSVEVLADIASILGHHGDAAEFAQLAADVESSFNDEFFNSSTDVYSTGNVSEYRQTSNVFPLAYNLVPDGHEAAVAENLSENVMEVHDGHLDTGAHGTKYLLPVLTEHGYHDVAYTVATQRTYPSWGLWIENDMTALLERWTLSARSRDHYFLGSIDEWFYKYVAGIREPAKPGFEHVEIVPKLATEMDWAEATTDTVRGQICSRWERTETSGRARTRDGLILDVTIPGNATATVRVPTLGSDKVRLRESGKPIWNNGNRTRPDHSGVQSVERDGDRIVVEVGSGEYQFELEQLGRAESQVDSTAPTAPSNLSSPAHDASSADLDWDAASDSGTGIDHYNVYVDGAKDHEVPAGTTLSRVTTLSSGTSYDFHVIAVDGAGNESSKSNTITVTTDTTTVTVVDDFEDGNIGEYGGETVDYAVNTSAPVSSGSYSLKLTTSGPEKKIASTSGLNAYPSPGDTIVTNFQPGSDSDTFSLMFAADSAVADPNNRYDVNFDASVGKLFLYKIDGGNVTRLGETSIDAANNDGQWLEMKVDWGSNGSISAIVRDAENGEAIGTVSATDSTFTSGGIGYRCQRESSTAFAVDDVRLE